MELLGRFGQGLVVDTIKSTVEGIISLPESSMHKPYLWNKMGNDLK